MTATEVAVKPSERFRETAFSRKKRRAELYARVVFGLMALALVVPLVGIVSYLVIQAWPLLSWDFLVSNPTGGMRHGGIWSALLGTIYLVTISLCISAPRYTPVRELRPLPIVSTLITLGCPPDTPTVIARPRSAKHEILS